MNSRAVLHIALVMFLMLPVSARPGDADMAAGMTCFYQENWDDAISHFKQTLRDDPQRTLALCYLLHTYYKKEELNSFVDEVETKARDGNPVATAHFGLVCFLRGMIRPDVMEEALGPLHQAVERDPALAIGYCGLGMVSFQQRKMPRSKQYFLETLRRNPEDVMALELLGNILLVDEKEPEEALEQYQKINALLPTYPDGQYYTGSVLLDLGQNEAAVPRLELALELDPKGLTKGADAAALLGDVYLKMGQPGKARAFKEKAFTLWGHQKRPAKHWDWVEPPGRESEAKDLSSRQGRSEN